jgi:hypothetical protein
MMILHCELEKWGEPDSAIIMSVNAYRKPILRDLGTMARVKGKTGALDDGGSGSKRT